MNLNKLLRKHSRVLLMVFMSLLLIAFLVPSSIQGLGDRARERKLRLGEVYGRSISTNDLLRVRAEMHVIQGLRLPFSGGDDEIVHYLLTEEARQMGVRVGQEEVKKRLTSIGVTNALLQAVKRNTGLSYDNIYDAIGKWLAVLSLIDMQAGAITESLPRLELAYRDQNQEAVTYMSVVDAQAFVHRVPDPTPEELQAFFDQCKARDVAHAEEELVFGYRLPDRVQIEYLTVDPEQIRRKVIVRASQVEQFFEDNRQRYTKPDPEASPTASGQIPTVPLTFEEARAQVTEDCRTERAIQVAQSLVNDMYGEACAPWRGTGRDEDGFSKPPQADLVSFEALKERYSKNYEVQYEKTELLDESGLRRIRGFGQAGLLIGSQRLVAPQLAMRIKGILEDPNDGGPAINVMEPAPVVLGPDRNWRNLAYQAYLFRVTEAAPSAPPDSFDDVREQVVEDWKLKKAYELAREQAESLAAQAREVGLFAAVEQANELKKALSEGEQAATQPAAEGAPPTRAPRYLNDLYPFSPAGLTREAQSIRPRIGRTSSVPKAVFELIDSASDCVTYVPLADRFKWVVAEVVGVKPIYAGDFEQQLPQSLRERQQTALRDFLVAWFNPENVEKRTGFKRAQVPAP